MKKFRHKQTGEIVFKNEAGNYSIINCDYPVFLPKFIENTSDWEEIEEVKQEEVIEGWAYPTTVGYRFTSEFTDQYLCKIPARLIINPKPHKANYLHLCDTCKNDFATCKSNPKFGNGKDNDNVYECDSYKVKHKKEYGNWADNHADNLKPKSQQND